MKAQQHKKGGQHKQGGRAVDNSAEFHALFSAQFLQRYAEIFKALAAPVQHVALLNSFTTVNDCDELGITERVWQQTPVSCYRFPDQQASYPPPPSCPYTQLKQFYWVDLAAVLPPLLLGVQPQHVVLDMCAAPGVKSLVLAMQLLLGQSTEAAEVAGGAAGGSAAEGQTVGGLTAAMLQQLHLLEEPQQADKQEQAQPQQQQQEQQSSQAPTPAADAAAAGSPGSRPGSPAGSEAAGAEGQEDADDAEGEEEDWAPPATSNISSSSGIGHLVCNEVDPVRRGRLGGILSSYIPGSLRRRVRVTGHDAAKHWARFESGMYDRVLLDAPCSAERQVVQAAIKAGGVASSSSWSRAACSDLAAQQLKLLLSGLRALKPGGRLVYSTSSMAMAENDGVVQQALQQSGGAAQVVPVQEWGVVGSEQMMQLVGAELTECGMLILPDRAGWGPVYLCLLHKKE